MDAQDEGSGTGAIAISNVELNCDSPETREVLIVVPEVENSPIEPSSISPTNRSVPDTAVAVGLFNPDSKYAFTVPPEVVNYPT